MAQKSPQIAGCLDGPREGRDVVRRFFLNECPQDRVIAHHAVHHAGHRRYEIRQATAFNPYPFIVGARKTQRCVVLTTLRQRPENLNFLPAHDITPCANRQ